MLDVRRLVVLQAVARHGSISAAGQALNYTASAVSQQIAALEREVGMRLLLRGARGVVLTQAGEVLVAHAGKVIESLETAEAALADLAAMRGGQVRLASFATASATVVPWAVERFRAAHPQVDVHVEQATSLDGVAQLKRGDLDVVLTVDQDPAPGMEITTLFEDPFRLALHRTHPKAHAPQVRLAELVDERWIDVPRSAQGGGVLARVLGPVDVAHASDDYTAIHELVGAGLGIALLPTLALFPAKDDVVLRDLGPDGPRRRVQAATRPAAARSPAAAALLAILRDYPVPTASAEPSRYVGA